MARVAAGVLCAFGLMGWGLQAAAQDPIEDGAPPQRPAPQQPALEPEQVVTGIERPGKDEGQTTREVGSAILWLPRTIVDYTFRGTSAAAGLIADEQLVPRYRKLVGAPAGGDFWVFPTLFAETGSTFSVGARMIADTRHVTTSQRFGFGGMEDLVTESRVLFKGGDVVPWAISAEAYYEIESEIEYYGIGITPERDPRNHFVGSVPKEHGLYLEKHVRGLGGLGLRFASNMELYLSASIARRQVQDSSDVGDLALSRVFEPGSITGVRKDTWIGYAETAVRFDSRPDRGKPMPGALVEGYTGGAHSTEGADVAFMRFGWRVAGFIPIYRRTNILSPRLVVDRLVPLGGLPVPFNELPQQPDFRGLDTRRDNLSMVASLDYSWELTWFMGLRLFADGATVAPGFAELEGKHFQELRYAGGFGMDFYTRNAEIGRFAISASPDGPRILLELGGTEGYGDRQHRD